MFPNQLHLWLKSLPLGFPNIWGIGLDLAQLAGAYIFGDVSQSALKPIASELECCHSRKPIQAAHYIPSHCYSHPKPQPRSSLHHLAQEVLEGWLGFLGYALHITVVALKKVSPTDFRMQCLEYCLQHHLWNTYSNLQLPCELSESFPKFRKLAYAGSANLPYISHRWLM